MTLDFWSSYPHLSTGTVGMRHHTTCGARDPTQGFMNARQAVEQLNHLRNSIK